MVPMRAARITFPVFLISAPELVPFVLPGDSDREGVWPVFSNKDNAAVFVVGRPELGIAEFINAQDLHEFMETTRPPNVTQVWSKERPIGASELQFFEQVPAEEFFRNLKDQADEERKFESN